ncbi:MAG: SLC13 family permease [Nitrospiraceae bacterium]
MRQPAIQESMSAPDAQDRRHGLIARWKRVAGLVSGPVVAGLVYLAPLPALSPAAHTLATILVLVVLYWITEPIPLPVTALLGTVFCVFSGLGSVKSIFALYAHPIIFLFMGSFLLAEAMAVHGVDRRVAIRVLALPWTDARPSRILLALGTVTAVISMWISNTAAAALMLPSALGILTALRESSADHLGSYRIGLMMMLSYAATAGGMTSLIGTPPNMLGVGLIAQQAGVSISFLAWMALGLPLGIVLLFVSWALLLWLHPSRTPVVPDLEQHLSAQRAALGPWTRGQINACVAFGTAVVLWIVPGVIVAVMGVDSPAGRWLAVHLPPEVVAILAAGMLFVLPVHFRTGAFTLTWRQAAGINWGILVLFGGGLAFGHLMVETGLAKGIGEGFVAGLGAQGVWSLTAIAILVAVLISELVANTATAAMLVPVVIAIAQSAGVSPVPPALGATLGASLGFALPVSTPPNAIVYGTGLIPLGSMIRAGLLFDLVGAALIWVTLRLLCPILGLV